MQSTFTDVDCIKTKHWRTPNFPCLAVQVDLHMERKNSHSKCRRYWKYWSLNGFYCEQDRGSLLAIMRMENLQQLLLTYAHGPQSAQHLFTSPTDKESHHMPLFQITTEQRTCLLLLFLQSCCSQDRQDWGTLLLGEKTLGMFRQIQLHSLVLSYSSFQKLAI